MTDYTAQDLRKALDELPLEEGDIVFTHSNLAFFGRPEDVSGRDDLCALFYEAIRERIGDAGTLVVPTFTYSLPRGEVYDPAELSSAMGIFPEWICRQAGVFRSEDPNYSVAAIGGRAAALTENPPENSFGADSFFDRFYKAGGKILNFNIGAGSTFVHYVERELNVPYRFDKSFAGTIRQGGTETSVNGTIWVRYLSDDSLEAVFEPMDELARAKGYLSVARLGRGEVTVITAADTYRMIEETLPVRPYFLTKAEAMGITEPVIEPE